MTLKEAKSIFKVINEYAEKGSDSFFTSFGGKNMTSGSNGKKADNIATGEAKPYKDDTYLTQYEKSLPHLGQLTQRLKTETVKGALEVVGPALEELMVLLRTVKNLKQDEQTKEFILPLGDNLRLIKGGQKYFIKYNKPEEKKGLTNDKELVSIATEK